MELGHDTVHAVATVVDLVNTMPTAAASERLAGLDELAAFVERRDISRVGLLTSDDLDAVRRLRAQLHAVFTADDEARAVELVNDVLSNARVTPRLTVHDSWPMHIHYFAPDARLAERLAAECGMALAFVLAAGERQRLASCAAPECERVLVDFSRNRSRRYCDSRTCGNRLHVAAYRARQRPSV